jgi:hypothetical protein
METAVEKLHVTEKRQPVKNDHNPRMKEEWLSGCQNYLSTKY